MEEELISLETAKLAKEKGFDWECINLFNLNGDDYTSLYSYYDQRIEKRYYSKANYNSDCFTMSRPPQSLLQKWIRKNHEIHCMVDCNASGWYWILFKTNGTRIKDWDYTGSNEDSGQWDEFEDAMEDCLFEALKLIK